MQALRLRRIDRLEEHPSTAIVPANLGTRAPAVHARCPVAFEAGAILGHTAGVGIWLDNKRCQCDASTRERSGIVQEDGAAYCKYCRGRVDDVGAQPQPRTPHPRRTCRCDEMTRARAGVVEEEGVSICSYCGGAVELKAASEPFWDLPPVRAIPVTTLSSVPGHDIVEILGLVHGVGNVATSVSSASVMFTSSGKAQRAMDKAEEELRAEAATLQADAVVAVQIASNSAGATNLNRAQMLQLVGTAVRLRSVTRDSHTPSSVEGLLNNDT